MLVRVKIQWFIFAGNKNNNCSFTFINITFKSGSYIELDRMNFNFINCTFEKMPIKIDSQTKTTEAWNQWKVFDAIFLIANCI